MTAKSSGTVYPFQSKRRAEIIDNHHTDIIITEYVDRLFIVITQFEKMGSMILVKQDVSQCDESKTLIYTTKVLFGQDEPEINAVARNLMEQLNTKRPVIFSLALKNYSSAMVRSISKILHNEFL